MSKQIQPTAASLHFADTILVYAQENYEKDGWDIVVETMSREEIAMKVRGCRTENGAINRMRCYIQPTADQRTEVQAEGDFERRSQNDTPENAAEPELWSLPPNPNDEEACRAWYAQQGIEYPTADIDLD